MSTRVTGLVLLAVVAPAGDAAAATTATDLRDAAAASFALPAREGRALTTVAALGDVNGDGREDFAIGRPVNQGQRPDLRGTVSVVFGGLAAGHLQLGSLAPSGFEIDGPAASLEEGGPDAPRGAAAGTALARAGDVNGDGLQDVLIGAPGASPANRLHAGSAYIVFGKRDAQRVDLTNLGSGGFRIDGDLPEGRAGSGAGPAGDVNADGRDDVLVGTGGTAPAGRPLGYVVFGRPGSAAVDLRSLGTGGYRLLTSAGYPDPPYLGSAGDVNADGRADVLVSVGDFGAFVVFGREETSDVDLTVLGRHGFALTHRGHRISGHLAPAGDVNRDGRADVLFGAPELDARRGTGAAFVVFGRGSTAPVRLESLGSGGYEIAGATGSQDYFGGDLRNAGDFNGDGLPDVVVAGANAPRERERLYVVYGRRTPTRIDVGRLGGDGVSIDGPFLASHNSLVYAIAAPGDLNADGRADLAVGGVPHTRACRADLGAVFVIHGRGPGSIDSERLRGVDGYALEGARPGDRIGSIVQAAGDVNGDGRGDVLAGSLGEEDGHSVLHNPFQLHLVTSMPRRLEPRRSLPTSTCLRARVLDTSLHRLVDGSGLRVRVALRRVQSAPDHVVVNVYAARGPLARFSRRGRPMVPPLPIATLRLRFRRAGVRTGLLRVNPYARRELRRVRRMAVRLVVRHSRTDAFDHQRALELRD